MSSRLFAKAWPNLGLLKDRTYWPGLSKSDRASEREPAAARAPRLQSLAPPTFGNAAFARRAFSRHTARRLGREP
jgi:hypothetical protein